MPINQLVKPSQDSGFWLLASDSKELVVISIIIVNWNSGRWLESCVGSLLKYAAGYEIVVVDNGSTDSSMDFVEGIQANLTILRNEENVGFAAGSNQGWHASKGDPLLFLNPDTECLPESVERLQQAFAVDKMVCAVGGQLVTAAGKSQSGFNVRAFPSTGRVAAEMLFINKIWPFSRWLRTKFPTNGVRAVDVDQPAAACLMITKRALEAVGGFDEKFYPAWFEDVDLCWRIHKQGGRILYHPAARFLHHGGYSLGNLTRQRFLEIFHENQIRYFKKHHSMKKAARVRKLIVFGLMLRSVLSLIYPLAPQSSRLVSIKAFWKASRYISSLKRALP